MQSHCFTIVEWCVCCLSWWTVEPVEACVDLDIDREGSCKTRRVTVQSHRATGSESITRFSQQTDNLSGSDRALAEMV